MVDALSEARRVLTGPGVLVDVRPVVAPLTVAVVVAAQSVWARELASYSAPDDIATADAAVRHAVSNDWFAFEKSIPFDFEIFCDTAAELNVYAQTRKLCGEEIPYGELEERRLAMGAFGQAPRLLCRRPWMLSTYRKR
jgi:hypothetical protein